MKGDIVLDHITFDRQTESALYITLKDPSMLDGTVFARMENDDYALGCLVVDEKKGSLMYSTQNLIPLSSFFRGYTFEKQEGYLFLLSILEKAIAVNRSKPVVLDTDYIFVSSHGDEVYFVVLPLQLEFWMFQKNDCLCFLSQILDEMKCSACYELPGFLVQFSKAEQFSLPTLCSGIRDLMDVYYPKKMFRKRMSSFRTMEPVYASFYCPSDFYEAPSRIPSSRQVSGNHSWQVMDMAPNQTLPQSPQQTSGLTDSFEVNSVHLARKPSCDSGFAPGFDSMHLSALQNDADVPYGKKDPESFADPTLYEKTGGNPSAWKDPGSAPAGQPVPSSNRPGFWMQEDALYDLPLENILEGPFADPAGNIPITDPKEECAMHISEGMGSSQVWMEADPKPVSRGFQKEPQRLKPAYPVSKEEPAADQFNSYSKKASLNNDSVIHPQNPASFLADPNSDAFDQSSFEARRNPENILQSDFPADSVVQAHPALEPGPSNVSIPSAQSFSERADSALLQESPLNKRPAGLFSRKKPYASQPKDSEIIHASQPASQESLIPPSTETAQKRSYEEMVQAVCTVPVTSLMEEEMSTSVLPMQEESWGMLESAGHSYALRFEVTTIGRHISNDICLPSRTVSSRHARIYKESGRYYVQDLGSTNKTRIFGRIIQEKEQLLDGMELIFGDQQAVFHAPQV